MKTHNYEPHAGVLHVCFDDVDVSPPRDHLLACLSTRCERQSFAGAGIYDQSFSESLSVKPEGKAWAEEVVSCCI